MSGSRAAATDDTADLFSNMPGFDDETSNTDAHEDTSSGSDEDGQRAGAQPDQGTEHGSREDTAGSQPNEDPTRIVRRQDGLVERQSQDDPRRRDLVDPVTGQVVARGGIERRVYEQGKRAERELQTVRQQNQQLQAQVQGLTQAGGLAQQLGLSAEAQSTAMRVMANFQRDPVNTLEYLISEVKAKGYNIPSLNGQGGQTDLAAFERMIDQRLRPFTQQAEQVRMQEEAQAKARRDLDSFLDEEPDARANLDIIAEMLQKDTSLNLNSAYIRFIKWCSVNQLDPTQHVGPQLQTRQQVAQQTQQPGQQPRTRPLPNGRQMNGSTVVPAGSRTLDTDASWDAIVRESMAEAGYTP